MEIWISFDQCFNSKKGVMLGSNSDGVAKAGKHQRQALEDVTYLENIEDVSIIEWIVEEVL